jgi:hypothetical protein
LQRTINANATTNYVFLYPVGKADCISIFYQQPLRLLEFRAEVFDISTGTADPFNCGLSSSEDGRLIPNTGTFTDVCSFSL